jgi:hypothetical protein
MKQAIAAVVVVLVIFAAWWYDQNNQPAKQTVQQVAPTLDQPVRGSDDMRSLKIP